MLLVVGLTLLLFAVLALAITAWSMWLQSHLYTEVSEGLVWRGPAAAAAIMLPVVCWMLAARGAPDTYKPLWEFNSTETTPPLKALYSPDDQDKLQKYVLMHGTRQEYRLNGRPNAPTLPPEPKSLFIEEDGQKVEFRPERDASGNLLRRKTTAWFSSVSEHLRYVDSRGRIMEEGSLGQFTKFKGGALMMNLFLNALLFAACFLGLWLLARFQWPHALGQAVILWVLLLLTVIPPVIKSVEENAPPAAKAE